MYAHACVCQKKAVPLHAFYVQRCAYVRKGRRNDRPKDNQKADRKTNNKNQNN